MLSSTTTYFPETDSPKKS